MSGKISWYPIEVSGNDKHILLFYKKCQFCHLLPFAKVGQYGSDSGVARICQWEAKVRERSDRAGGECGVPVIPFLKFRVSKYSFRDQFPTLVSFFFLFIIILLAAQEGGGPMPPPLATPVSVMQNLDFQKFI